MNTTHRLVVQSAVLGSLLLSVFGFLVVPAKATIQSGEPVRSTADGPPAAAVAGPEEALAAAADDPCDLDRRLPETVYRWCSLIMEQSGWAGLDADLVAAVILVESAGDPLAYSHSGAVGLMQVMPRDGLAASFQCVNGPCFTSRPTRRELEDPVYNVGYGTRMLADLIERYGDIRIALKAYGPMDVGYTYADKVLGVWQRYSR